MPYRAIAIFCLLLLTAFFSPQIVQVNEKQHEEYVYYGVIPSRIYFAEPSRPLHGAIDPTAGFEIDPLSVARSALIAIIALQDDTNVKVYTLDDGDLIAEARLNFMEKFFVKVANGTRFKVVSNNPVTTMILGGNVGGKELSPEMSMGPTPNTFLTSIDGRYVGKEFIFIASQGLTGTPYRILALEDSEITVTCEDGAEESFRLKAYTYKGLSLKPFKAYRVKSTGHVIMQCGGPGSFSFQVPSAEGGFVGRYFFSSSITTWDTVEEYGFKILSQKNAKVSIWDVEYRRKLSEIEVKGGEGATVKPNANEIMIESSEPITVIFAHNGSLARSYSWAYGAGVTFMAVRANEEALIYLPQNSTVEAYIFAYEDSLVNINDATINIRADSFFCLTNPGVNKISSDKTLIIQIVHWPLFPQFQGISSFGAVVPCIQTVGLSTNISISPIEQEGSPVSAIYIYIGVAAAIIVASIGYILAKRRLYSK
ncbi:MAG: hypothetical protein QW702_02105 [Candidatus Bathyarchaeia archaeon]